MTKSNAMTKTPLGKLTAIPRPQAGFRALLLKGGERRKGRYDGKR